ncbi:hypothetical protein BDR05DRAFT_994786 [Suillus weaverae]|nr:hypothetical protein BDR05DRAFT_994786 [Suillus weaverae]
MFMQQFFINQEFQFKDLSEQPLGLSSAADQLSVDPNKYPSPLPQYPNPELCPPDLPSIQEPEPLSSMAHKPQSQQNNQAILQGPQYENEFVHWDIAFSGYGVLRYMQWDLGAAEAPRAELEHQTQSLVPASTSTAHNVEASESSESSDSDSEDDQTIPIELTRTQMEGVSPTRKKHARTVKKALKVGRIAVVGHVKYTPFETQRVKEEMVSWMSNICRLFKDYAIYNIQKDLSLCLPIKQQGTEVPHKKRLVPMLLESLDFLHKFAYDETNTLVCYTFEADWFVNMIVDVIFLNGLHPYVNAENFNSMFGLAGAAAYNTLSCFRKGTYKNIDASTEQFCDPYSRIIALIKLIQSDDTKRARLMQLCNLIIMHGQELIGLL